MDDVRPPAPEQDVCVLMPVHAGTRAAHLEQALESIERQTAPPDEVLLVQDGPLGEDHSAVIAGAVARIPGLRVLQPGKVGLVGALNAGLVSTQATWVARMDADDVAEPERLQLQLRASGLVDADVIGGAMAEFEEDPSRTSALRRVPESHRDISRLLPRVNPVNHPTVMMRREAVAAVDGYLPLAGMEDYFLWARMAAAGCRFHNLPDVLVHYRVDHQSYQRRADRAAIRAEWTLQRHLRGLGLVGPVRSTAHLVVRVAFRLLPPALMRPAYAVVRSALVRRNDVAD